MKITRKKERAYLFEDLDPAHVREIELGLRARKHHLADKEDDGKHEVQKSVDALEELLEELGKAKGKVPKY